MGTSKYSGVLKRDAVQQSGVRGYPVRGARGVCDLPLVYHSTTTGARWSFAPVGARPFNYLGCIDCRGRLCSLPVLAEERRDALEDQY